MDIMEMSGQMFIQILCELFLLRMDNLQAGGLFREYNKHVALRYVQWNLTKIADSARREY